MPELVNRHLYLYGTVDDLILSYAGINSPMVGVFVCEDIAEHISRVTNYSYDVALSATVSVLVNYGLVLTYPDVCDIVDDIIQRLETKDTRSWHGERNIRR